MADSTKKNPSSKKPVRNRDRKATQAEILDAAVTNLNPPPINFASLANATGIKAWRVKNPNELKSVLTAP